MLLSVLDIFLEQNRSFTVSIEFDVRDFDIHDQHRDYMYCGDSILMYTGRTAFGVHDNADAAFCLDRVSPS